MLSKLNQKLLKYKQPIEYPKEREKRSTPYPPVRRLATEHQQKILAFIVAIFCLIIALIAQVFTINALRKPEKVFVLDGSDTLHVGPLQILKADSPLFVSLALLATQVIFQRSPIGLDLPELLNHLFRKDATEKLKNTVNIHLEDLKARNLHQKPEISQIKSLSEKDGVRILEVQGSLIGAGSFEGLPISESQKFRLMLAIVENPNLSDKKMYPFVISDFKFMEI